MQDHDGDNPSQEQPEQPTPDPGESNASSRGSGRRARAPVLGAGAAALVVIAAVVAVIATSSGGSSTGSSGRETPTARAIGALLAGIPQHGNALGSPTAPVTLQYFGDLQCLTARLFTLDALPSIIRKWVRPGTMRIEFRSLRTVSDPKSFDAQQVAALAAGRQNKLWYYIETFYYDQRREHSGYVTESYLSALARQVPGLNFEQWRKARRERLLAEQVASDEQAAFASALHSTPALLIGRVGSPKFRPTPRFSIGDLAPFNEFVRQILHGQPNRGSVSAFVLARHKRRVRA